MTGSKTGTAGIGITRHAEKRMRERCGLNRKSMERVMAIAWEKGVRRKDARGALRRWMDAKQAKGDGSTDVACYGDKAYIVADCGALVTVLQLPCRLVPQVKRQRAALAAA